MYKESLYIFYKSIHSWTISLIRFSLLGEDGGSPPDQLKIWSFSPPRKIRPIDSPPPKVNSSPPPPLPH